MMNRLLTIALGSSIAVALTISPLQTQAQSTNKTAPPAKSAEKKSDAPAKKQSIPFQGHLLEINKTAKTIKVDKRTFEITHDTKIHRGDKEATLEDGVKGEYVTGSYKKGDDGKLIANSVYFGGKNKEKAKDTAKPADKK
jgi:hypothetical protein